ncbi:DUF4097 family beta strand repeat-containing protein [Lactobacillus sp. ESL0785]|uniref:DUF4097 family beta strand repeat-containing protein n=1 Tax=Lactobacillus sp. ESL0785 TaxID=2983232 RepID=UPI0023F67198|nr:DUF4097 family beta strand repeat-containing protein [Lactobacillus sp. ESL0785]WEV70945.1 DUF4097 family beta strand repeat-containing protein [Lactobacillus sp. ESL0785]
MSQITDNYIKELAHCLTALQLGKQCDALEFYRGFLLDGDFQTIEEIKKELGSPSELAQQIQADYHQSASAVAASCVQDLASDNYVRGFHLEKNPVRKRTLAPGIFTQIKLNLRKANLFIHSGKQYQVVIMDYNSRPINVKVINQTLLVDEQPAKQGKQLITINWKTPASHVEITVPNKDTLSKISGHNNNGVITIQNLQLQNVTLLQDNGNTLLNNVTIKQEFTLHSQNGDLTITQTTAHEMSLRLRNGNINIERSCIKLLLLQMRNGNSNISQCNLTLTLDTQNGDIKIARSQLTSENLIRSKAGNLFLKQLAHDASYHLQSTHGDIFYHQSSVGSKLSSKIASNDSLKVISTDGDINII